VFLVDIIFFLIISSVICFHDLQIPFCVVIGWMMGQEMDLNFQLFETATLFITVLVVAFMLQVCLQKKNNNLSVPLCIRSYYHGLFCSLFF